MFKRATGLFLISLYFVSSVVSQVDSFLYDFSRSTVEENGVTITGAGFGAIAEADYSFGAIPTDNAFDGATDGYGLIIQADPGEGVMVFTPFLQIEKTALIRCSIRASASHVSAYLATIDQGQYTFVSTITPNNGEFFHGKYNRLADIFLPPSTGFQGVVQIINTSEVESLTAYVDNFEIKLSDEYNVNFPISDILGLDTLTQRTPTHTSSPTPTLTPDPIIKTITIPLDLPPGAIPLEMIYIRPGTFIMGSPYNEEYFNSNELEHHVSITQSFFIGKFEITQAQWLAVMGNNPSTRYPKGDNYPIDNVSWNDCQQFIQKLNQLRQKEFRLPTEAEWEYACRAGKSTIFFWGDDSTKIKDYAWYSGNALIGGVRSTQLIGQKKANSWGLYDMSGNVSEWTQDWYAEYSGLSQIDPTGPVSGLTKVNRGGNWGSLPEYCRSAYRYSNGPDYKNGGIGFRIVLTSRSILVPTTTPTPILFDPTNTPVPPTPTITPTVTQTPTPIKTVLPTDTPSPIEISLSIPGTFTFQYNGQDTGNGQIEVDKNGSITGVIFSNNLQAFFDVIGIIYQDGSLIADYVYNGVKIGEGTGNFVDSTNAKGIWKNYLDGTTGSWFCVKNPALTPTQSSTIPTTTPTPTPKEPTNNESITVSLVLPSGAVPLEIVLIPAGTFMIGSPDSEERREITEGPQHEVTISQPFYMGKYEVTQAQWQSVMGNNPSEWNGDNLPVENVSWDDVQEYIKKLNQFGQGSFRLPTEAEWEYACRAGTSTRYYWGEDLSISQIGEYAWYTGNSNGKPHVIGQKQPNAWGLYDMSGNLWEWCQDWYGSYGSASQTDPTGPSTGSYRVIRGGGWGNGAAYCRSAFRSIDSPDYCSSNRGFRLLRSYP